MPRNTGSTLGRSRRETSLQGWRTRHLQIRCQEKKEEKKNRTVSLGGQTSRAAIVNFAHGILGAAPVLCFVITAVLEILWTPRRVKGGTTNPPILPLGEADHVDCPSWTAGSREN